MKRSLAIIFILVLSVVFLGAQEDAPAGGEQAAAFGFSAGMSLGTDVIPGLNGTSETWNSLGFQPDISFGKFGLGIDITLRFKIMPDPDTAIEVYQGDWIPNYNGNGKTFFDLYLPIIQYVRWGQRGDPLFVKLGSINDLTIGNGFIMGNYSNTLFMPAQRIFGLSLGLDGNLFKIPYFGLELVTGNLARFDVLGGRLFVRPLAGTEIPVLNAMQLGGSIVTDTNPTLYRPELATMDAVTMYGADIMVPLIGGAAFPLNAFTEIAFQPKNRSGWMIGVGGRLVSVISYGAQLRILQPGFIPAYFDSNYDVYRAGKASIMAAEPTGEAFAGWFASLGFSGFKDKVVVAFNLEGPAKAIPTVASVNSSDYPHLRAIAVLGEGILGGFFFDMSYDKYYLGKTQGFFQDIIDPTDTIISAAVNYKTGAAVFTLGYDLTYNPLNPNGFDVTSSLKTSIKF